MGHYQWAREQHAANSRYFTCRAWGGRGEDRRRLHLVLEISAYGEEKGKYTWWGLECCQFFLSPSITFLPLILLAPYHLKQIENRNLWSMCLRQKLTQFKLKSCSWGGLGLLTTTQQASLSAQQKHLKTYLQFCSLGPVNNVQTFSPVSGISEQDQFKLLERERERHCVRARQREKYEEHDKDKAERGWKVQKS